jgi:hypothetical protein
MSVGLDDRARRAAEGLHAAVEQAPLWEGVVPLVPTPIAGRWVLAAGALAGVVALALLQGLGTEVIAPENASSTTLAPTSTTALAVPTTAAIILPPPTTVPAPPPTTTTADLTPPAIEITSPSNGTVLREKSVTFLGTTEPGAEVRSGRYGADVSEDGEWSLMLILAKGSNMVTFVAEDAAGNEAATSVTVTYEPEPPPTTTSTTKAPAEFKAFAKYLSCESSPPFDEYYGTAAPGTIVTISSEYGGATAEAGPSGEWQVKVFFETAPYGVTFEVTVSSPEHEPFTFPFTSYAA